MEKEARIEILKCRIRLLESRGPHNSKLCSKLWRKIRQLERES